MSWLTAHVGEPMWDTMLLRKSSSRSWVEFLSNKYGSSPADNVKQMHISRLQSVFASREFGDAIVAVVQVILHGLMHIRSLCIYFFGWGNSRRPALRLPSQAALVKAAACELKGYHFFLR